MEDLTLKIRVAPGESFLGRDCGEVARSLVGHRVVVLDAKWGRDPTKWRETGGGWGRLKLTERQRGFLDAVKALTDPESVEAQLIKIIEGNQA